MYLKLLAKPIETHPARILIRTDVEEVHFFSAELTQDEFRRNWDHVYLVPGRDPWMTTDAEGRAQIGCLIYKQAGKSECMVFNGTAFLCNNQGKAVERFMAE